jgi:PhnB protein
MAAQLNPYLTFPGTAREAMTFYQRVLGGELTMNTFGEYGQEGAGADGIMHAHLETPDGFVLMASDTAPGQEEAFSAGTHMSVSLSGDDQALRRYWDGLAEGATVTMPLEKQMWGDEFGMLTDRFGIPWMVNIGSTSPEPDTDSDAEFGSSPS